MSSFCFFKISSFIIIYYLIKFSDSNGDVYTTIYTIEKLNTGESIELKEETTNKMIDAVDYRFHIGQFNPQG